MGLFSRVTATTEAAPETRGAVWPVGVPNQTAADIQAWLALPATESPLPAGMALPTIFRCVSTLANRVAQFLPEQRDPVTGDPLDRQPSLLRRLDDREPLSATLEATVWEMLTLPESYVVKHVRPSDGVPNRLEHVPFSAVQADWVDPKFPTRRRYQVDGLGARGRWFDEGEVIALSYTPRRPGVLRGAAPLGVARATIDGALAAERVARSNFTEGVFPTGALKYDDTMPEPLLKRIKADFLSKQAGSREPLVLDGGVQWENFALTGRDAQWVEHRQWSAGDLARLYGYPPALLGIASMGGVNLTYQNMGDVKRQVVETGCAVPMLRWAQALERWVLPGRRPVGWDVSGYLPADEVPATAAVQGPPVPVPAVPDLRVVGDE